MNILYFNKKDYNKFLLLLINIKLISGLLINAQMTNLSHEFELIQTTNLQRQELLQKMCDTLNINERNIESLTDDQLEHLLIDRKHKMLYCYVPKVIYISRITFEYS